jgi:hypothetical protein
MLRRMVDPSWFDADAIADAGNVAPSQMQAGFTALRPTLGAAKLMSMHDLATDPKARDAFLALEEWASDNYPGTWGGPSEPRSVDAGKLRVGRDEPGLLAELAQREGRCGDPPPRPRSNRRPTRHAPRVCAPSSPRIAHCPAPTLSARPLQMAAMQ